MRSKEKKLIKMSNLPRKYEEDFKKRTVHMSYSSERPVTQQDELSELHKRTAELEEKEK